MDITDAGFSAQQLQALDRWYHEKRQAEQRAHRPSMAIIASKGTLDAAYPPFILASTAASMDWDVTVFFSFYGLALLKKDLNLKLSPLGNPAMPMKIPYGPDWLRHAELGLPNLLMAGIPGFEKAAAHMMRRTLANKGIASVGELRELALEAGVKMVGCQMTADLFGWEREEFLPEVSDWVGAASFLPIARNADVTLYM